MARTTLTINDDLLRQLRKRAADEGRPLKELVNRLLRDALRPPARKPFKLRWRTERGKVQPGVRLDDRDALFDLMEGR